MIRKSISLPTKSFVGKFVSSNGRLPDDKESLRTLSVAACERFLKDGGTITICRPGVAVGASFTTNKHPRNGIVGAQSPLTV